MTKRYLTEGEQRRLLMTVESVNDRLALRDAAWMRLMIETGMRVQECTLLRLSQAQRAVSTGWLVMDKAQRKGKRAHEYMVTGPVAAALKTLMRLQAELVPPVAIDSFADHPLMWGRDGGHISVRSLQARMKEWAVLAKLPPGVSPHWLRHTRGMNIMRRSRGKNALQVAQRALGHASIASTGIYTQMSREEYEAEIQVVAGGRMRLADARLLVEVRA